MIGPLKQAQLFSAFVIACAIILLIRQKRTAVIDPVSYITGGKIPIPWEKKAVRQPKNHTKEKDPQ